MTKKAYHNNPKPKTVKVFGSLHTYMKFSKSTIMTEPLETLEEPVEEPSTALTD